MELRKEENKVVASSDIKVTRINDYIRVLIDIYSAAEISRTLWLTEREKEFLIAMIIHVSLGEHNPISDNAVQIYKKYFNPETNKTKISDYINRVRTKKWVRYNKRRKVVEIPAIFHNIGISGDEFTFNLKIGWEG